MKYRKTLRNCVLNVRKNFKKNSGKSLSHEKS